jgi:hypothetical protein
MMSNFQLGRVLTNEHWWQADVSFIPKRMRPGLFKGCCISGHSGQMRRGVCARRFPFLGLARAELSATEKRCSRAYPPGRPVLHAVIEIIALRANSSPIAVAVSAVVRHAADDVKPLALRVLTDERG